ncbi:hypothetical protein NIES4071_14530 [Calothrix sp. NIES-4071]|nr:hypothetical protein NIES4071_14530 [Calothrix sp. NIES-4071]BAZ55790.1 hypothetical protein NIES4105_14480 [Calothrix sp. NIES-4105]
MLNEEAIEKRLTNLEREVAVLKQNNNDSTSDNWLNKLIGSISDQEAFDKALEYGRSFRQSDKPANEGDE